MLYPLYSCIPHYLVGEDWIVFDGGVLGIGRYPLHLPCTIHFCVGGGGSRDVAAVTAVKPIPFRLIMAEIGRNVDGDLSGGDILHRGLLGHGWHQ